MKARFLGRILFCIPSLALALTLSASTSTPFAYSDSSMGLSHHNLLMRPDAKAAQELSVSEVAHLHLVSHHQGLLNEEGVGSGTFHCPLTVSFRISYTTASISYGICRDGGSFSGSGKASFYTSATSAHFEGTVSITHGTGRYAHASTSGLRVSGTFQRSNYALSLTVSGNMHV
jgi:hypothetical protein